MAEYIHWNDFKKIEIRVGTVVEVNNFPEAIKPAYQLKIDLGSEIGIKKSSAQITDLYHKDDLLNKLVVAVINFPHKQIGPFMSECLVTGFHNQNGYVVLCVPDKEIPLGMKLL